MDGERTVLVLTQAFDPTADRVVEELGRRGIPVFRCDPGGDFPHALELAANLHEGWTGTLRLPVREVRLENVRCAWYRRPTRFDFGGELSRAEARWATLEARGGLGGVVATLPHWLNHPNAMALAEQKPVQLAAALRCGLTVPETLITSSPRAAREFVEKWESVVYKPLSSSGIAEDGSYRMIYTSLLDPDVDTAGIGRTTHMLQALVPKICDIRLTCVDGHQFPARINAHSPAAAIDFRSDYDGLTYSTVEVPAGIRRSVDALMTDLRLRYAAIDFALSKSGEWVFLGDVNPNGQWAWIEDNLPELCITSAIADALAETSR
jgi:ATP-grasp ribosomal peptide maturase